MTQYFKFAVTIALCTASATIVSAQTPPVAGYKIDQLGLVGPGYVYQTPNGPGRFSNYVAMNASGLVIGSSQIRNTDGQSVIANDAWIYDGVTTIQIGLLGAGYELQGPVRESAATSINMAGQVTGISQSYGLNPAYHAWFYDGSTTQKIGLYASGTVNVEPLSLSPNGRVAGESQIQSVGRDAWLFDGVTTHQVGFTGFGYEWSTSTGISRASDVYGLTDAGTAVGVSIRHYNGPVTHPQIFAGYDVWSSNGPVTTRIGLTGNEYEWEVSNLPGAIYRYSGVTDMTSSGNIVGYTQRRPGPSNGDGWLFDGVSTVRVGLSGGVYEIPSADPALVVRSTIPRLVNEAGQVVGSTDRYGANGELLGGDAWFYNGTSAQPLGLNGTEYEYSVPGGILRRSDPVLLTDNGMVGGVQSRSPWYDGDEGYDLGQDAWIFNGATTARAGLTGSEYETSIPNVGVFRYSELLKLNSSGQAAGITSHGYVETSNRDAWFFDGQDTKRVNLIGDIYEYGNKRDGWIHALNDAGQVLGESARFNDATGDYFGETDWFYDDATDTLTPLEFSVRSDGYSLTEAFALTDTGVVLGRYRLFNGDQDLGDRAFWWSLDTGMIELGELVAGGLDGSGWQLLSFADTSSEVAVLPEGAPYYIAGAGLIDGQADGQDVFLLTANIPEPTTIGLFAVITTLARRRSRL